MSLAASILSTFRFPERVYYASCVRAPCARSVRCVSVHHAPWPTERMRGGIYSPERRTTLCLGSCRVAHAQAHALAVAYLSSFAYLDPRHAPCTCAASPCPGSAPNMCITIVKRSNLERPFLDNRIWVAKVNYNDEKL